MSGKLICSATECVHNMKGRCSANAINVGGSGAHSSMDTDCDTFAEGGFKNAVTNIGNMNITGEIKQLFGKNNSEMNPAIKCDAISCTYNSSRICTASNVEIYGPGANQSAGTQCETFKE